jgi:hypothetical protein
MVVEYSKFKKIVCDEVRKKLNTDGFNVQLNVEEVWVVNGKKDKLAVVNLVAPDAFPVFYFDDLYVYYCSCENIFSIIKDMVEETKKAYSNIKKMNLTEKEVRDKVFFSLINREKNKELLKTIPHREFLDLAVIYYLKTSETTNTFVTNYMADSAGISEDELYAAAYENTPQMLGKICRIDFDAWFLVELKNLLGGHCKFPEMSQSSENEMFVFKYANNRTFSVGIMLYLDVLEKTAELLEDDLVLAIPDLDELVVASTNKAEDLQGMCRNGAIQPQKFLSSHVYIYNRKEKKISIQM